MEVTSKAILLATTVLVGMSCGSKDDDGGNQSNDQNQTVQIGGGIQIPKGSVPLFIGFSQTTKTSGNSLRLAGIGASLFRNKAIASGPAEELRLTVTGMSLGPVGGGADVPIFTAEQGRELILKANHAVDMTNLFTEIACLDENGEIIELVEGETCHCGLDADGGLIAKETYEDEDGSEQESCPELPEGGTPPVGVVAVDQTGRYSQLNLTLSARGRAKGCASGTFEDDDVEHTYCTRSSLDPFSETRFVNGDFEDKTAELMGFNMGDIGAGANDQVPLEFPLSGMEVAVYADTKPRLTLLVDTSRFVRYYNGFVAGSHPEPGHPSTDPVWFSPRLQTIMFGFPGRPGAIQGYSWSLRSSGQGVPSKAPEDYSCPEDGDQCHHINGWMTVVYDTGGAPLLVSFLPDDDNALTVVKGANVDEDGISADLIEMVGGGTYNLTYALGETFLGTVYGVDLSVAVGETQETYFIRHQSEFGSTYGRIELKRSF